MAREYLAGRGLTPEGIKTFRIGYAPDSFNALRDRLSGMADEETLRASGLFSSKEQGDGSQGPIYDRFRKRVMFPICNESGRVIAFTARTLETGEKAGPKYINSPETPLYSKGQVLFNLDKAKPAIRQAEFALLVEGQMDCISRVSARDSECDCDQRDGLYRAAGGDSAAAYVECGGELRSGCGGGECGGEVDCAADRRGIHDQDGDAGWRAGSGPVHPRARAWRPIRQAVRGARRQSDYLIERARQMFPGASAEQKVKAMNYLLPHIRRMPEKLARDQFAADAAQKLGIDSAVLREELRQAALRRRDHVEVRATTLTEVERVLLRALAITDPEGEEARRLAAEALTQQPAWFEQLGAFAAMQALAGAGRAIRWTWWKIRRSGRCWRRRCWGRPSRRRRTRWRARCRRSRSGRLRAGCGICGRRLPRPSGGAILPSWRLLTQQKLELDRALRQLHGQKAPER